MVLSSVSVLCQLKISCLLCSLAVNSVFKLGLESMARHGATIPNFFAFGPRLNIIEDPWPIPYGWRPEGEYLPGGLSTFLNF